MPIHARHSLRVLLCLAALLALPGLTLAQDAASGTAAGPQQQRELRRAQIQAERQALQAGRSSDEAACYQQFAVHDCLNQVRARVREAENRLRRQELQINDEERREKADERRRSIEERQQEQRQNLQSGEKPPPMRATERGNAQARAQQAQQRAAEQQHRAAQQAQEQQERQQAEAQRASESRARYDAKQQKARERREQHERDKAQAQASGRKPPAPLPAP